MATSSSHLPCITVITVVLNGVESIESTITSVINQPYKNLKYIVIDGGSTDGTVDIIKRYENSISFWISEKDCGIYDAMNKGWARADAESFILFIGAGDRLLSLPESLERYSSADIVFGDVLLGEDTLFNSAAGWRLRIYNSLHHQALLINKQLHQNPPFNTHYKLYADFDLNQRLLKSGARFIRAAGFLSFALPGGISDRTDISESLQIIRKNFGFSWAIVALTGFFVMAVFPPLRVLRPFSKLADRVKH